ncbi:MAG: hypothetical protein NC251_13305 [Lachnoclostridium sp.]|nr:hypothetical protein [Lachnospira sp.]MCM1249392.1 hypothetical protein [Lachnoclostridium sp.]MCM1536296.1 hypothetical protein [Clostridium sp.]
MMSKRLFFKVMKEDFRHKIWMFSLSVLGSLLALPVAWLLFKHNLLSADISRAADDAAVLERTQELLERITDFFGSYAVVLGGGVAIVGGVIAGLFSFYYLFHKNMVDTWHSIPVKRSMLYGIGYVNGLLIWLVPLWLSMLLTVFAAGGFTWELGGREALLLMMKEAFSTLLVLAIVYLLVYHLMLTAVMFCGNVLNALISAGIMGFGAIVMFAAGIGMCSCYLTTFSEWSYSYEPAGYASPLFSAIYLIYRKATEARTGAAALYNVGLVRMREERMEIGVALAVNLAIAAALGLCAWFLYQKRKSELAEQGISNRFLSALLRIFGSVAMGLLGGCVFIMLTEESLSLGWALFGMIFFAILTFGVLDMAFSMDVKGFFVHKLQMGAAVGICLMIGMVIQGGLFGYDTYLPPKDKIAGISVYYSYLGNRTYYGEIPKDVMERMNLQDLEVIYPYLEKMTANAADKKTELTESSAEYDVIITKVMLKNNKSYYRKYKIYEEDKELLTPILSSREYIQAAYAFSEEEMNNLLPLAVSRPGSAVHFVDIGKEELLSIVRAYNQDVLENPEGVSFGGDFGKGKLLSAIYLAIKDNTAPAGNISVRLDIYETMEHTLEALAQAGYEEAAAPLELSDISSVELLLWWYQTNEDDSREALIAKAREYYGVFGQEPESLKETDETDVKKPKEQAQFTYSASGVRERKQVSVTDRKEIEELADCISPLQPIPTGSIFEKGWVQIAVVVDNKEQYCYIPYGALPEKYILRFGEF